MNSSYYVGNDKGFGVHLIELDGRSFEFSLHHRELPIGGALRGGAHKVCRYYWMDSGQFRTGRAGPNYRACVDYWWAVAEQAGASGELENQMNLVLAECYPLVNTGKAVQDVFLDAYLDPRPHPERPAEIARRFGRSLPKRTYSLPLQEVDRIRAIVARRDVRFIQLEFESLFVGALPPPTSYSPLTKQRDTGSEMG